MRLAIRVLALTAIGAAAFVPAAHAQDMTTYSFAGTTLCIGGGFQYLTLPDIKFTGQGKVNNAGQTSPISTTRRTAISANMAAAPAPASRLHSASGAAIA